MNQEIVVGLEVHAELNTKSKAYCDCKNSFGAEVNTQICPSCMGMPGTLPSLNSSVVDYAILMGHALNCKINSVTKQDRKHYFYPDLVSGYQKTQNNIPLCENGHLDILVNGQEKRIGITRIHIEEDTGKLLHDDAFDGSLCDYNRSGVPLIEIVTEPDLRSSEEVKQFLETVKSILQYLDICECKIQEGNIRCDVNVSIREKGQKKFGTRCEMKNVSSFSAAMRAVEYEAERQKKALASGEQLYQETRRWDDMLGKNFPMRSKEDAMDYRFFPEPDLGTIVVSPQKIEELKRSLPELPNNKIKRFVTKLGLSQIDATLIAENLDKCRLFEETLALKTASPKIIANWVLGDISKFMNDTGKNINDTQLTIKSFAEMLKLIEDGTISNSAAKTVFEELLISSKAVAEIIEEKGLSQISDESLIEDVVKQVLADNQKSVEDYKNGKTNALGFLVGQCMKATKGKANPTLCKELVLKFM